ncbi:c804cba7-e18e-447c-a067-6f4e1b21b825 [Sclerotinia trifoliorum]|uniref:C804cba7-e18e-447c-a067-6f4e1b21b825 n=1 Tax=Sclerotinia trifoliorum TaxID=28548 RepID=A0A8H2ZMX4_9HELO|nr:c804cba7-e18e-447c-a067-6f4e1b21b825 [Sclerotinia trifoliorum]
MNSSRKDRLDPCEAEARAELENPRGQPAEYVDQRQNPEWCKAKMDKAMEKARGRCARSTLQLTHGQLNSRGSSTMTSPQQQNTTRLQQYKDLHDQEMAKSQLDMDNTNVNCKEYFVQDEWAKSQLRKIGNTCPRGCRWIRIDGGCRCGQGFHWATDLMLSEGEGGIITTLRVVPKEFPNCGEVVKAGSRYD